MNLIRVNCDNIEKEHICCAISNNNDCQVASKKSWLRDRFYDGLVFLRGDVRGKCFIEYIPAEAAWVPVSAEGYMYIDCLWVSGQFKGQGNSTLLLDECMRDSKEKGKRGLCILSAKKKIPFLADSEYLKHKGFIVAYTAEPFYVLYYLPFDETAPKPLFRECVGKPFDDSDGFVIFWSRQCPFTAKYVPILNEYAAAHGVRCRTVLLGTAAEAQSAPSPSTSFSLFYNGKFVTNEILSEKIFGEIISKTVICG